MSLVTGAPSRANSPARAARPSAASTAAAERATYFVIGFVLTLIVCQVALLFEVLNPYRVFARSASFGASLAMLGLVFGKQYSKHPARGPALLVIAVMTLQLLNPANNLPIAALAQVGLYLAILGPLFWVGRLRATPQLLGRVLMVMWAFHTLSATVGVLQVYDPARFMPSNVAGSVTASGALADGLKITLTNGETIWRPMGLTDSPGGAAGAGLSAVVFGAGFFLQARRNLFLRLLCLGGMGVGLYCIYICQVRSSLVIAGVCVLSFGIVLLVRGEIARFFGLAIVIPAVVMVSFIWALASGGDSMLRRLETLVEEPSSQVYYRSRGRFLESTWADIPEYPLGRGLGHWGMISYYFGDPTLNRGEIWVEVQLTAWLVDGGLPIILAYGAAFLIALWSAWRIAQRSRRGTLELWAALVLAYNIGVASTTFSYVVFISQTGMEFWLLNALLVGADADQTRLNRAAELSKAASL